MGNIVLTDKSVTPNNDLVFSIIGEKSTLWQKMMHYVHEKYPDSQEQWNYYKDGKSWLFRMIRKKKTLFWIGVLEHTFRITFWFGDKADSLIEKSNLPEVMKAEFRTAKRFNKIRALSIQVENDTDIENAIKLTEIRIRI